MSANVRWKGTSPPTIVGFSKRMFLLPHGEDRMILSSFVWIGHQHVTDGRTELRWLIQHSALQAVRPRCKNYMMCSIMTSLYSTSYSFYMTKPDVASTLAFSFRHVCISSDLCMLLRQPLHRIPQTELTLHNYCF